MPCESLDGLSGNWNPFKGTRRLPRATFSGRGVTTETYKDWHEKLPFALHAYRTGVRTSTEATSYSLVYQIKAVLLIKVEIPSLRVLKEVELEEVE